MKNNINDQMNNSNVSLEETLTSVNLNKYLEDIYKFVGDKTYLDKYEENSKITQLRNKNHKQYHKINIYKIKELPDLFDEYVSDIVKLYDSINGEEILDSDLNNSENIEKLLDSINVRINRLDNVIKNYLKEITLENDEKQKKLSRIYLERLNVDDAIQKDLIEEYNDLILYSSYIETNIYDDAIRQAERKKRLNKLSSKIYNEKFKEEKESKVHLLKALNEKIDVLINNYIEKIEYLEDLIIENSKYKDELEDFKTFFNKIIAYDDEDYENTKQTFELLSDSTKIPSRINNLENIFIEETDNRKKEEKFIYENIGIKNLMNSLDYISANYMDKLDLESKQIIEYAYNKLNSKEPNISELNKVIKLIVRNIWKNTITDINSYKENDNFYFICSNNQFIDPKYQAILISKKEIEKVDDYLDYQIGFICGYNDNILYITENDDIMTVSGDDMSDLKTPYQLEQEFLNFKVCNRIALNGYITKIEAVYFINDGDMDKYVKAVSLANMYNLPLIEIKK